MKLRILLAAVAAALSANVYAANQGVLGDTSTGDLTITATITPQVKISNLDDITVAAAQFQAMGATLEIDETVCVFRSGSVGTYQITASGDGGTGGGTAFLLDDGTNDLTYSVDFDDGTGASNMTAATALTGQTNAENTNDDCATAGADNGTVTVIFAKADVDAAPAATYTGVLTLTVAAE